MDLDILELKENNYYMARKLKRDLSKEVEFEDRKIDIQEGIDENINPIQKRAYQIIDGWSSVEDCAATVWASIHSSLLDGELVYAYRNTSGKSDLQQLVIVKNLDRNGKSGIGYSLGMITTGFTVLYPLVEYNYLIDDVIGDMKKYKLDKSVIENYRYVIEKIGEKYGETKQDFGD